MTRASKHRKRVRRASRSALKLSSRAFGGRVEEEIENELLPVFRGGGLEKGDTFFSRRRGFLLKRDARLTRGRARLVLPLATDETWPP